MTDLLLKTLWLLLPAGIANMSPVLVKWIPFLNVPVDCGIQVRKRPLFGKNKTYRGFLFGTLMAIAVVYLQTLLSEPMRTYSILNYTKINVWHVGFLLGFGALLGDMIESFFKRQIGVTPGSSWPPFDQIDWILGGLVFVHFFSQPLHWSIWITGIVGFGAIHPLVNLIGYFLKIKKNKF